MSKKIVKIVTIILMIVLSCICLFLVVINDNQASMSIPLELEFAGEYSYDGKNWHTYVAEDEISVVKGEFFLKGHFDSQIEEGAVLNFFCNHIGVSIYVNGELIHMDVLSEVKNYGMKVEPSMCGKKWEQVVCPQIKTTDIVEFRFMNYHKYGNKNAYQETISTCCITPSDYRVLEVYLRPYTKPFQILGNSVLIIAIMLLGASISAFVLKSNMVGKLFKMGMTTLFFGAYIVFDIMLVYLMDELLVIKTYGRQLCIMLAVFFLELFIRDCLSEKRRKVVDIVMWISGITNNIIIIFVILGKSLIFDTQPFWIITQICISSLFIFLLGLGLVKKEIKISVEYISYIAIFIAILVDISGFAYNLYYPAICSKLTFIILLMVYIVKGAYRVIVEHNASIKNAKLQEELENSRITIMLSQIQPHFLYNSLTSVMDLCDRNPKHAKTAIADFADYLRGNLSALSTEKLINFRTELEHIEKYLKLEKLRFGDELEIKYSIKVKDFMIPVLSIQPIVENAVKHGVGKKIGGGTICINTFENENDYIIQIIDDGVGFIEEEYLNDGVVHIGLENVRKRLDMMIYAHLEIESKKGEGTKVSVYIPKGGA